MEKEREELSKRINELRSYLLDETKETDVLLRDLMIAQLKAMETYISILSIRMGLTPPKDEQADNIH